MTTLNVYLQAHKVGVLNSDDGRLSFRYDKESRDYHHHHSARIL